ncbi:FGGY-family carbohydrate kinase [Thalassospira profundimaris]|uniref:Xylulose kinase n=1 Tax=Thalassospira profundimaris TaxID=502049 RepID=A0A367X4M9_9PROT|nr:FGGY-family carbohydrate kinase [Thalassospira profundimaris]RCK48030.1 xylulose kinase [Thalassospira profundimaris]
MARYFLGIDAGNTVVKTVLFDAAGREIAHASREAVSHCPAPGFVERDIDQLRNDLLEVVAEVIRKSGVNTSDIAAIGSAGHGNGLYLLGAEGKALLGVQSLDTRANGLVDDLTRDGVGDISYPISGQRPWVSQTPTLLAWVKRERPDIYGDTRAVLLCKDVVTHALTGVLVSDISDMGGCGMLRMPENIYDDDLLDAFGILDARDKLPRLAHPSEIVGHVTAEVAAKTGLCVGTPVVAGFFDVIASALGSGVARPGQASMIVGTWSINQIILENIDFQSENEIFMSSGYADGRFMSIESSATSAVNLEWLVREYLEHDAEVVNGKSPFDLANELVAQSKFGLDGPYYHPYLYGAPCNGTARAGFFGVGGWHGRGDMLRAIYEGVTFAHLQHMHKLRATGAHFDKIILSGGGARSTIWPQIIADILELPLSVAKCQETGALGAAMAAAVGVGMYHDYDQAADSMVRMDRHYSPALEASEIYRKRFAMWRDLEAAMLPFWSRFAAANA